MINKTITRQCLAVIIGALCVLLIIIYPQTASAINLKHNSVVTGNTLKLGDVFHGLPRAEDADRVLGIAPQPGTEMVLNARTLMRIALAMDLEWRPQSTADYVVISRAATVVDRDIVETAIKDKLKEEGLNGSYKLLIPNEMVNIVLPYDQPAEVAVTDVTYKRDKNWFEATVVAPSLENPIYSSRVSGTIENLVDVPVLTTALRSGTLIGKYDIEMITVPERTIQQNTILSADELIGTTPRRMVSAGQPVQADDVQAPQIVERGEMVTMTFHRGALQLTAKGKALENGAKGDVIRVVNTGSNKTLEAIVTASKEVSIEHF